MGTYVDTRRHFPKDGCTVEQLPVDVLIGPAIVAYFPNIEVLTVSRLANLEMPPGTGRLLLRTRNSELWVTGVTEFREDYAALRAEAARWVVDQGIHLIGVDYLSVQRYGETPLAHETLLGADIIGFEGLNLNGVQPEPYEIIGSPVPLKRPEAAPAHAVLRRTVLEHGGPKKRGKTS